MKGVSITLLLGIAIIQKYKRYLQFLLFVKNDIWTLNIADVSYDATENA